MGTTPNVPQEEHEYEGHAAASVPRWVAIAFAILFVATGWLLYAGQASRKSLETELAKANQRSDMLANQLEEARDRLEELKAQFDVTSDKLGVTQEELNRARQLAQAIRKEQKASDEELLAKIGAVEKTSDEKLGRVSTEVAGAKSDIEATRKDLEAAKTGMQRMLGDMNEMSGLIATNREEVEELKRRGERNIFEFDLRKSKVMTRVGPVQLRLNKADAKRFKYTMTVYADDRSIEKKDKTANEPVQFYVRGVRAPYEIVVFDVQKDRAIGYLSTPKEMARR